MEVQQTNILKPSSDFHSKLIDNQENPSVDPSFDKKKDSSDIHQRNVNLDQEARNPGSLAMENAQDSQAGSQLRELSPSFERFYKALTMISMGLSTGALLWMLFTLTLETKSEPLNQMAFPIQFLSVIQSVYAYRGSHEICRYVYINFS